MAVYTQESAKACIRVLDGRRVFYLGPNDRLTASARAFLEREQIEILAQKETAPRQYKTLWGATLTEKPEHMTHLRGNILVPKTHPRIAFRGMIDLLESEILLCQKTAQTEQLPVIVTALQELLDAVRQLIRCDVLQEPVDQVYFCGLDEQALRKHSHHPEQYYGQPHFMPDVTMSATMLQLNHLRAIIRQTELAANRAFQDADGAIDRPDIVTCLNRMSSLVWILMIRLKAGKLGGSDGHDTIH